MSCPTEKKKRERRRGILRGARHPHPAGRTPRMKRASLTHVPVPPRKRRRERAEERHSEDIRTLLAARADEEGELDSCSRPNERRRRESRGEAFRGHPHPAGRTPDKAADPLVKEGENLKGTCIRAHYLGCPHSSCRTCVMGPCSSACRLKG
jgi:hypothetical protein